MIWLCGDTHGEIDLDKVTEFFQYMGYNMDVTKDDLLIILGDAGAVWDDGVTDELVQSMLSDLPCSVAYIDGNHENFHVLDMYPEEEWNGGRIHRIKDDIIHLMRGQIYEIEGKTFFTFGGGYSVDKYMRTPGESWWPEEMPSEYEYEEGLKNLKEHGNRVDYVLTHTCPKKVANVIHPDQTPGEEELQEYLQKVADTISFDDWYFGHWHDDASVGNFTCLWYEIIELED